MKWIKTKKKTPAHKQLVLCKDKNGLVLPSIHYDNDSFKGFYPFSTFYHTNNYINGSIYNKVRYEEIKEVVEWVLMPEK